MSKPIAMPADRVVSMLVLSLALVAAACRPLAAAPEVVVTIKPVHALVAGVMEGVAEPALLMDGMASPHTYQMRPSEAALLARADLVVWVGPGIEGTLPRLLESAPTDTAVLSLMDVEGLRLLPARAGGLHGPETGHDEDPHNESHNDDDHGDSDPHVWLDPVNAMAMTREIARALAVQDPENAQIYAANAAAQLRRLEALDTEIRDAIAPVAAAPFLTFHDAYQYFETAYDLNSVGAVALGPERMPGGRSILALREAVARHGVVCVFTEPHFEPGLTAVVIEGSDARVGTLDPLGANLPAGPGAYDALLRAMAGALTQCLGADAL